MLKDLWTLYSLCFRMGAVTFGGGYAMLPILKRELVESRKWFDEETLMDYYALSQCLPGLIAVNVSVFVGYRRRGVAGAVAAALGMVSPCIIIISIIAFFLSNFKDNVYVKHALSGISICVAALILDAVLALWKKGVKDRTGLVICIAVLLLSVFTRLSPIIMVVGSALFGIVISVLRRKRMDGGEQA